MEYNMERVVSEEFYYSGKRLKTERYISDSCRKCFFRNFYCSSDPLVPDCASYARKDNNDVYYIKI